MNRAKMKNTIPYKTVRYCKNILEIGDLSCLYN
jgi:hypothetical protein